MVNSALDMLGVGVILAFNMLGAILAFDMFGLLWIYFWMFLHLCMFIV